MAITVKHSKVSAIPDGADPSVVRPSDWNAEHVISGIEGTLGEQNAGAVEITGGAINATTIGYLVPSSGYFTSLTANSPSIFESDSSSAALTVRQLGTGNALQIEDQFGDSSPVVVDAEGRLVVGSDTAVAGTTGQLERLQVSGTGGASSSIAAYSASDSAPANVRQYRKRTSGGLLTNDILGANAWFGHDGEAYQNCALIRASAAANYSAGSFPTYIFFATANVGDAAAVERMRISAPGNLLIGTTTDNTVDKLQVNGSLAVQGVKNSGIVAQTPTRSTVASGSTITLTNSTNHLLYDQAATVAALTVTLPSASLTDGQIITIATRSAITALTLDGGTIYGAPTTLTAGGFCTFIYSSGATAWFRKG